MNQRLDGRTACERMVDLGRRLGLSLWEMAGQRPVVAVGQTTAPDGDMLSAALIAGLCCAGADVLPLGVVPAPAVSFLTTRYRMLAGVWVDGRGTAPLLFGSTGAPYVLPSAGEQEEREPHFPGRLLPRRPAPEDYVSHLLSASEVSLLGMRLVVDCGGGTAAATARRLFSSLEAECVLLNDQPSREPSVWEDCRPAAAASIEQLAELTVRLKHFAGIAFSPDGDRLTMVDEKGDRLDSDRMLAALALDKKEKGTLPGLRVAVEDGTNGGLFHFLKEQGIQADRVRGSGGLYGAARLSGAVLAGDGAGRLLDVSHSQAFDGQLAALQILTLCRQRGWKLSRLLSLMERMPEVTVSVRADSEAKERFRADDALRASLAEADRLLGDGGRIRAEAARSEPLIFVRAEGRNFHELNHLAVRLAKEIAVAVGAPEPEAVTEMEHRPPDSEEE
ncbi:MAG: hypothetical protein HFJ80_00365 [Clostridiales bacterium]|nr:hypothetical protein [Clostridiales bacterium]